MLDFKGNVSLVHANQFSVSFSSSLVDSQTAANVSQRQEFYNAKLVAPKLIKSEENKTLLGIKINLKNSIFVSLFKLFTSMAYYT